MKAAEASIFYTPRSREQNYKQGLMVIRRMDDSPGSRHGYAMWCPGLGYTNRVPPYGERVKTLLATFNQLVRIHRLEPQQVHEALLQIDEYRDYWEVEE